MKTKKEQLQNAVKKGRDIINEFKVITLCGSTRFKNEFLEAQKRLTLEGNIVISVGLFDHSGDEVVWTEDNKDMLERQHLAKIDLADEIFVINVGGYIGDSTRREIAYAAFKGKTISYLEKGNKRSFFDNWRALIGLYESGKFTEENWEKIDRWIDEERDAAIAEYNACQGPWPYVWKNIDTVVWGILQTTGLLSIDYFDLKYLYDEECVYEIRIEGKGANFEERLQCIIDTIRNEYWPQLRSSKKIVLTAYGSQDLVSSVSEFHGKTLTKVIETLCGLSDPSCLDDDKKLNECIDKFDLKLKDSLFLEGPTKMEVSLVYAL